MPAFEVDNPVVSCDMASSSQHKCCDKDQSCLLNLSPARGNVKFPDCCVQNTEQIEIKPQNPPMMIILWVQISLITNYKHKQFGIIW